MGTSNTPTGPISASWVSRKLSATTKLKTQLSTLSTRQCAFPPLLVSDIGCCHRFGKKAINWRATPLPRDCEVSRWKSEWCASEASWRQVQMQVRSSLMKIWWPGTLDSRSTDARKTRNHPGHLDFQRKNTRKGSAKQDLWHLYEVWHSIEVEA